MPRFKSKLLLGLGAVALVTISLVSLYLLFSKDYTGFISWFLQAVHKPHLQQKASSFLSAQQFTLLRIVTVLFSVLCFFLLFICYRKREQLITRTQEFSEQLQLILTVCIKDLVPANKLHKTILFALLGLYLLRSIITIIYYPIDFDEADTYLLFSSQGPLVSATFYPLPNNHILYSIITSITSLLPIDPVYALRLPLIPIGFLCIIMMYAILKKYFSVETALIGLSFFISLYPLFIYSFLARGYLLLIFFYLLCLYAVLQLCILKEDRKRYYYLLTIASVGGLYTIPSFLYALAGLFLFAAAGLLLQKRTAAFIRLFNSGICAAFVATVLYLPVLISANWKLLKPYLNPVYEQGSATAAFETSYSVLAKAFLSPNDLVAIITGVFLLLGSVALFMSRRFSNRPVVLFVWLQLVISLFVFFVFKQQFPAKPWMHFTVVVTFGFAAIVQLLIKRNGVHPFILVAVSFLPVSSGTLISYNYKNNSSIATGYNSIAKQCEALLIEQKVKEVYTEIPYFKTMVDYYAIKNHLQVKIYNSRKASRLYAAFDPNKKYDLIISYADQSKLPPLLYAYDTVLQKNNTTVLLIRK